ncbi:hypothetical protein L861_22010 [Litchfieldella anticariensis FP35 = DSM 16096]|uniref:Uncharacterized protein n=1 Tax=Litchfieldella anticariensis (strain DSM 16096 / CECT 5854 / CIP 108499 / LMG 22089 / FP35) TaxID=1121939 RepID=S2KR71_LITA3|nr:hypothetical protein [Halomonas anticariensis]EPC02988.1 hypothetical protein L861_22010 [Halomonas anticariensis FP35 = DSM 16096]
MIWHLIAALFAGLGTAGVGLLLRSLSGKRLPRWIIPVCGGLGILAFQIHHEYSWFHYKQQQLPESATVVSTKEERMFWRPWTYLFPLTTAFSVIDRDSMANMQANEEQVVEFILYRFEKEYIDVVQHQAYLMNCTAGEMLPLMGEGHRPRLSELRRVDASDPLFQAVCPDA